MGSSSKPQTTTQTSEPWSEQKPYLKEIFGQAQNLYQTQKPQYFPEQTIAPESQATLQARDMASQFAMGGNPVVNQAQQEALKTIGGDYLNANPYLDATYNKAAENVIRQFNRIQNPSIDSAFERAGRFGANAAYGTARQSSDEQARSILSGLATDIYGGNYQQERARQQQAMALSPQFAQQDIARVGLLSDVGIQQEGYNQDVINEAINRFNFEQDAPYNQLARYLQLVQGNYGGSSTSNQPLTRNRAAGALGGGLSGAATGAMIGSVVPGIGTGIGAAVGGGLGLLGGFL